jgi:hypothetical protein
MAMRHSIMIEITSPEPSNIHSGTDSVTRGRLE